MSLGDSYPVVVSWVARSFFPLYSLLPILLLLFLRHPEEKKCLVVGVYPPRACGFWPHVATTTDLRFRWPLYTRGWLILENRLPRQIIFGHRRGLLGQTVVYFGCCNWCVAKCVEIHGRRLCERRVSNFMKRIIITILRGFEREKVCVARKLPSLN